VECIVELGAARQTTYLLTAQIQQRKPESLPIDVSLWLILSQIQSNPSAADPFHGLHARYEGVRQHR
jgi:hypothetical protein